MKRTFALFLLLVFLLIQTKTFAGSTCNSCVGNCKQDVCAKLDCNKHNGGGGGGGGGSDSHGIPGGAIFGIAAGGASAAGAGGALLAAPFLLAGLIPNACVCAACPLGCACPLQCYLQNALNNTEGFCCGQDGNYVYDPRNNYYIAQNDSWIQNGAYEIDNVVLPPELQNARQVRVNVTVASQPFKAVDREPELALGIYKDINCEDLNRKFQTQQFLHNYLMNRYEVPLRTVCNSYNQGIQKLSGVINIPQICNKNEPLKVVVRYTENGFSKNMARNHPKTIAYAYLIDFQRIR